MGNENSGGREYSINKHFFKTWSPNMAYVLGFTCTDGCVYGRTLSWELSNKFLSDKLLLERFSKEFNSNYQVEGRKKSFRLRFNSVSLVKSLRKFDILENKSKVIAFPKIPSEFSRHFLRGVLDGDGWISVRHRKYGNEILIGLCSGSLAFMKGFVNNLNSFLNISIYNLRKRLKFTKKGYPSLVYQIDFYSENAYRLMNFLYGNLSADDLYLERKYKLYLEAKKVFEESLIIKKYGRSWLDLERKIGLKMDAILFNMMNKENLIPREIADRLGVSLATLYRWLEKSKVRIPEKLYSEEWMERILNSRRLVNEKQS